MRSWRIGFPLRVVLTHPVAAAMTVSLFLSLGGASAYAAGSPAPAGRTIAVSVPPDPVSMSPGSTGIVNLRVVNPGRKRVRVNVVGRGLTLGNEGKVSINKGPDPLWANRVRFPSKPFTVPAQGFKDLKVRVSVPKSLHPDLYFLGFVVTPVPSANPGVTVINQIGGFFTIDIPGPRDRRLAADLELPGFSILGVHLYVGSVLNGTLHVHNIGHAAVRFWGETDSTATGGSPGQLRLPLSLVPSLRERTFVVSSRPGWPIGFVHTQVRIVYPSTTEKTTSEILFTNSELVINPLVFVVLGILVLFAIWRRVLARRRRRRRSAVPAMSPPRRRFAFRFAVLRGHVDVHHPQEAGWTYFRRATSRTSNMACSSGAAHELSQGRTSGG
jgi:hypothetical protein